MITLAQARIKNRMATLKAKWKGEVPKKGSPRWWRYRIDKSHYIALKSKLKFGVVEKIFGDIMK